MRASYWLVLAACVLGGEVDRLCQGVLLELTIQESDDDAEERAPNQAMEIGGGQVDVGFKLGSNNNDPNRLGGFRFAAGGLPPGCVINSAVMEVVSNEARNTGDPNFFVFGHDVSNSNPFSNNNVISSRSTTSDFALWNNIPNNVDNGDVIQTVDLSAPLQELVNRNNWREDSPITLIVRKALDDNSNDGFAIGTFDSGVPAVLSIDFDVTDAPTVAFVNPTSSPVPGVDDDDGDDDDDAAVNLPVLLSGVIVVLAVGGLVGLRGYKQSAPHQPHSPGFSPQGNGSYVASSDPARSEVPIGKVVKARPLIPETRFQVVSIGVKNINPETV